MEWKRAGNEQWTATHDERFLLTAEVMGDGRWSWKVVAVGARAPMATGIVSSPGAAKHAMENFLKKKGVL